MSSGGYFEEPDRKSMENFRDAYLAAQIRHENTIIDIGPEQMIFRRMMLNAAEVMRQTVHFLPLVLLGRSLLVYSHSLHHVVFNDLARKMVEKGSRWGPLIPLLSFR